MKKCPKCGQICRNQDEFCDVCGCQLPPDMQIAGQEKKKSFAPMIAGCAAAVLVIAAVGIGLSMREREEPKTPKSQKVEMEKEEKPVEAEKSVKVEKPVEIEKPLEEEKPAAESNQVRYDTYYVVNCKESITLRKAPDTAAGEICQIPFGAAVSYVETADNGFYKIIYNGKTGFALAAYLDVTQQSQPKMDIGEKETSEQTYPTYYVVNCRESITLRTAPRTSADEICQIPLGAAVSYMGASEAGFYKIMYHGKTGYALASYLDTDFSDTVSVSSYMRVYNCRESITLRTAPDTAAAEICQIPLDAKIEYDSEAGNGFAKVIYNGYTGYALKEYLTDW